MGIDQLNPRNRTAEHMINGEDLLFYFREPVTGALPTTEFEALTYTGKVIWKAGAVPLDGAFAAETAYTAVVTLSADTDGGFAFNVPAAPEPGSFSHSRSADLRHSAETGAALTITIDFGETESESGPDNPQPGGPEIVEYNLQRYVPIPVAGELPITELKQPNLALSVQWQDEDGENIEAPDPFVKDVQYQAIIFLTARETWTFVKNYSFAYYPSGSVESQQDPTRLDEKKRVVLVTYKPTGEAQEVTDLDLAGHIPAPATDATAKWSILGKENQYTGTVEWELASASGDPDDDPAAWEKMPAAVFQPGAAYRAVLTLYAGPGYTLKGADFTYTGKGIEVDNPGTDAANILEGLTITFPATAKTPVTDMNLTSKVPQPVTGVTPEKRFEALQYTGEVTWTNDKNEPLSGAFEPYTVYVAAVKLTPAPGYTFSTNLASSLSSAPSRAVNRAVSQAVNSYFEHNGGTVQVQPGADVAVVTITFPRTASDGAAVTDLDLTGKLPAPVLGGTPLTVVTGSQYKGDVEWSPPPVNGFEKDIAYTAKATLTASPGWTFAGVRANTFRHDGASSAANAADSGVVTLIFLPADVAEIETEVKW
jgi:hypothetical protein